ncbi:MAG: pyridoxal 5'-phosphate synthase glutaminase subunit PdxT [Anaerolineae bacterium]|nr:pyridoxal 5'-phosphate synthase glutaminase subunit PdxT [Anaerolineae bacterium]
MTRIGILALQGDFLEHKQPLQRMGVEAVEVRQIKHLDGLDGLIIPGGESTTFAIIAQRLGMIEPLRQFARAHPTWGTCAGAIFLAKTVTGKASDQISLGVMDITVRRNAFGRQIDSFVALLTIDGIAGDPYQAVFIRAPIIESPRDTVDVLATLADGRIVAARQGHLLATSFHPELTDDDRVHALFLRMVAKANQ